MGAKGLVIPPKASANVAAPTLVLVLVLVLVVDDLGENATVDEMREAATDKAATDLELMNMLASWIEILLDIYRQRVTNCLLFVLSFFQLKKSEDVVEWWMEKSGRRPSEETTSCVAHVDKRGLTR